MLVETTGNVCFKQNIVASGATLLNSEHQIEYDLTIFLLGFHENNHKRGPASH